MENILIGTSVPSLSLKTIADVVAGNIVLMLHQEAGIAPILRGSEVTNAEIAAARGVQFLVKRADGELEGSLIFGDREITNKNYQAYVAGVAGIFKLGNNAAAATGLTMEATAKGEGCIRLVDLTDSYVTTSFPANICLDKKSSETVAQYLARFVAKINADPVAKTLVVAVLESAVGVHQIKFTTLNSNIKLGIATDGLFADYQPITVTPRVVAKGAGAQIVAIEKELTVFKGNGNYTNDNDLYYKEPLKASGAVNYNVLSLTANKHVQPTVSTSMFVASPNVLVCTPAADTTLAALYALFVGPVQIEE